MEVCNRPRNGKQLYEDACVSLLPPAGELQALHPAELKPNLFFYCCKIKRKILRMEQKTKGFSQKVVDIIPYLQLYM